MLTAQYITVHKHNIIMSKANNITSFPLPSESETRYNTLYLAGKEVYKTDEKNLVRFDFDIKLLYGRYTKWLFSTFIIALFIIIFNGSFKEAEAGVRAVVYAVLLLIPFFVMKIPKLIFDSSYEGTIEKIYTDDGVGNTNKAIPIYSTYIRTIEVSATLRLKGGGTKDIVLYLGKFDSSIAKLLDAYRVGVRVVHIRGAKHNQIMTADGCTCIVCGHFNKASGKTCAECGSTLDLTGSL